MGHWSFTFFPMWNISSLWVHMFFRDEIYCQILKQLTANKNSKSTNRGWILLSICLGIFPPTDRLCKVWNIPFLFCYLRDNMNLSTHYHKRDLAGWYILGCDILYVMCYMLLCCWYAMLFNVTLCHISCFFCYVSCYNMLLYVMFCCAMCCHAVICCCVICCNGA